jgi:hypothetical protein
MADFVIPQTLHETYADDEDGLRWLKTLPETAAGYLDRWPPASWPASSAASPSSKRRRSSGPSPTSAHSCSTTRPP